MILDFQTAPQSTLAAANILRSVRPSRYPLLVFNTEIAPDAHWEKSATQVTVSGTPSGQEIEIGQEAESRDTRDAQTITNHNDAIEFSVNEAKEIGFNRYTILNLHGILAQNLLVDPGAAGQLWRIDVRIERSTFHPLAVPQLTNECLQVVA